WSDRFAFGHSSTFANNNIACRVGLAVVDALTRSDLCAEVARKGSLLEQRLASLAARHPRAIAEVRGRGLLRGVEPARPDGNAGSFLSYMNPGGLLAYAAAAALAERHGVLVLPTLGESPVLRLTPPLVIRDEEIERAADALDEVCGLLERHDGAAM